MQQQQQQYALNGPAAILSHHGMQFAIRGQSGFVASQSGHMLRRAVEPPHNLILNGTSDHQRHVNGHMAHSNVDNPVDLSNSGVIEVNGLIKEEQQLVDRRHGNQAMYGHQGITVGIPDQSHGK